MQEVKHKRCTRCYRPLKTEKSMKLGFGPVCYQKFLKEQAEIGILDDQVTLDDAIKEVSV